MKDLLMLMRSSAECWDPCVTPSSHQNHERSGAGGASNPSPPDPQLQELLLPLTLPDSPGEIAVFF